MMKKFILDVIPELLESYDPSLREPSVSPLKLAILLKRA